MNQQDITAIKNLFTTMSIKARNNEPYSQEDWKLLGKGIGDMESEIIELQNKNNEYKVLSGEIIS